MLHNIFSEVIADFMQNYIYIVRMLIAAICGFCIGIERSRRQKDAGIRTHVTVALGAALFMIISKYAFLDVVIHDSVQVDASRIASCVVTGVSFLGAGVIFVKDVSIKGLTTAAGIWTTAGIGMAIGSGMFIVGICATILLIICQVALHRMLIGFENTVNEFKVVLRDGPDVVDRFRGNLDARKITMQEFKMSRDFSNHTIILDVTIKKSRAMSMREVLAVASEDENVVSIDF